MNKSCQIIGVTKRLTVTLLRDVLLRIYKLFIRPHLDCKDIIDHCVKSVQIRSFSSSDFFCIQSECRKLRTRKNSVFGTFHAVNNKPNNNSFKIKIENIQYKAYIAKTSATQGMSRERLYDKLCLESLGDQQWCRKLKFFL